MAGAGLGFAFIDSKDRPAIFKSLLAPVPLWLLHAALRCGNILATTLLPLRSMKLLLIALQFHQKPAPGQFIDRERK